MVYIACATYKEAEKLIKHYNLRAECHESGLDFYKGLGLAVLITRPGPISAAISAARFLALTKINRCDTLINLGASAGKEAYKNRLFLGGKLVEEGSGRTFFTDQILTKTLGLELKTIVTLAKPIEDIGFSEDLYEMEAASLYQAAISCLRTDRIIIAKYVSDAGMKGGIIDIEPSEAAFKDIISLVDHCMTCDKALEEEATKDLLLAEETSLVASQLSHDLSASVTTGHEIKALLEFAASLGLRPSEVYKEFRARNSQVEFPVIRKLGKSYLEELGDLIKKRFLLGE